MSNLLDLFCGQADPVRPFQGEARVLNARQVMFQGVCWLAPVAQHNPGETVQVSGRQGNWLLVA